MSNPTCACPLCHFNSQPRRPTMSKPNLACPHCHFTLPTRWVQNTFTGQPDASGARRYAGQVRQCQQCSSLLTLTRSQAKLHSSYAALHEALYSLSRADLFGLLAHFGQQWHDRPSVDQCVGRITHLVRAGRFDVDAVLDHATDLLGTEGL